MSNAAPNTLDIQAGFATESGKQGRNDDYACVCLGSPIVRNRYGVVAVIADGMGGARGGRVAAEVAVRTFVDGYYSLSEKLGVQQAAFRTLAAVNRWVHGLGKTDDAAKGMGSTFTAAIVAGRKLHVIHVGDSRAYQLRADGLRCLTSDHTLTQPELTHVLYRAVGLEDDLRVDYAQYPVRLHDRFLLCSDGVHARLRDHALAEILRARASPEETARMIVAGAMAAGSTDDATAVVLDIVGLPPPDQSDFDSVFDTLPIRPLPRPGEEVDKFVLEGVLSNGRHATLYRAVDTLSGRRVVMKFPHPRLTDEQALRLAFVREALVGAAVHSPWLGEIVELTPERQTRLYSVMPFYEGVTLEERLRRAPPVSLGEGIAIAVRLAKSVAALHRAGVIHRDIKPDNVILDKMGGLRLVDFGVARTPRIDDSYSDDIPGTPSFMAPELFAGAPGNESSDLYALGVTVFRLFTGAYPYGEIEPFSHPRFQKPTPLSRLRPDLPAWLDAALARATAVLPSDRFADIMEFAVELDDGPKRTGAPSAKRTPLYHRNPVRFWQLVSAALFAALLYALIR